MKKRNERICAMSILFSIDMVKNTDQEELNSQLEYNKQLYIEQIDEAETYFEGIEKLVRGVISNLEVIDQKITSKLINWTLDRLSYVDRAILRIATYELMILKIDKKIVIDEAIEITKEYAVTDKIEQVKFNNSLLDKIAGDL